eukprot:symbB.v1.2.006434.t1/scaffold384.1/size215671/7
MAFFPGANFKVAALPRSSCGSMRLKMSREYQISVIAVALLLGSVKERKSGGSKLWALHGLFFRAQVTLPSQKSRCCRAEETDGWQPGRASWKHHQRPLCHYEGS